MHMDSYLQKMFAERIGGASFGKDTTIYKFEKIKRAKAAAKRAKPNVELIDMGVGEPDDKAFPEVVAALAQEANKVENRFYADNGGADFRAAVKQYMQELYGVTLDTETEIIHSIGSKSALTLLPTCFINPGDITVMTIPGYPVLGTWTKYLGGEVVNLPLKKENGFLPDLEALTPEQRRRGKLIYLNYPNNPTGASATPEFYDRAIAFAKANDFLLVVDAPYAPLNFTGKPLSILSRPGGRDVAVELHSMSKGFNMTGWRLGWVCGNAAAIRAFATVKDNADSGQFLAIQKAAAKALANQKAITPLICEKYRRRLAALVDTLKEIGFDATMPEGSFFLYVAIPKGIKGGRRFANAEDFSQWMITEKLISTVPWDDVGHFVRFSATFVAPTLAEEERVLQEVKTRLADSTFEF
ncbi:MAG TPA: LL-diaminopimelate aminotransferase [Lentisphaeria bacterium]|nr:LL-diaminopimelate aminotransferase [Lentisphaerota bacterium]HPY90202.1 LL-diaminopimelate aminotransferase [Lentisphaeria bacterium]HQC51803.1 LL-diaminopimelate aminotransferase [Lentisphaeria bacterium]HQL88065.1 LL-diaminopimelate aminotransferase [Lentisphaeria bacterium]